MVEAMSSIGARVADIRTTLATLSARPVAAGGVPSGASSTAALTGTTSAADATSASFATALATQLAAQGPATVAGAAPAANLPSGPLPAVAGFTTEQVDNARAVVEAGKAMGLSQRDQTIGVMTALGESSLRVLDHGDTAGPDSRGLFQQRDNGAWGTLADRMDPTRSATSFYTQLAKVPGRDTMAPTMVAHTVQRNADPQHYTRYWEQAVGIVEAITDDAARPSPLPAPARPRW